VDLPPVNMDKYLLDKPEITPIPSKQRQGMISRMTTDKSGIPHQQQNNN
jgi:hypothetical protein